MSIDSSGSMAVSSAVASGGYNFFIRNLTDTGGDNTRYAGIQFQIGGDLGTAAIHAYRTNSAVDYSTALTFLTKGSGAPATNPVERMRIDSVGQLMVGTTAGNSSAGGGHFTGPIVQGASGLYQQQISINSGQKIQCLNLGVGYTDLHLNPLGGSVIIGTSTNGGTASAGFRCRINFSDSNGLRLDTTATSASLAVQFVYNNNTEVGKISTTTTSTAYVTSSDYRLKENVEPMQEALAKVLQLKPVTYTWKSNGSVGEGFIAHELAEVCPQAVSGEKDAVNEDESIKPQGIDTSFLVATLTAAIQELKAIVDAQAVEIAALKAK